MEMESNKEQNDLQIPDDVVFNILQRLPAKSLAAFMCVCKQWQSMITEVINYNNEELILVSTDFSLQSIYFNASKIKPVTLDFPFRDGFDVVGSVNGLLCVSTEKALVLWNPWTQRYKIIPSDWPLESSNVYGFGYDQCADDYIIVRIVRVVDKDLEVGCWVDIYSCKTDFWLPKGRLKPEIWQFVGDQSGFFVHGALYWHIIYVDNIQYEDKGSWLEHYDNVSHAILCFDLVRREFSMILPPEVDVGHKLDFDIAVLGGRLCMVDYGHNCHTDIWAWEGNGSGNWIKLMSIPCLKGLRYHKYLAPVFVLKNGEVLVDTRTRRMDGGGRRLGLSHEMKGKRFLLYNQEKKAFRELNISGIQIYDREMSYTKSLVSLPDSDGGHQSPVCDEDDETTSLGRDLGDLDKAEEESMFELRQQYMRTTEYKQRVEAQICGHLSSKFGAHDKSSTSRASMQWIIELE